MSDDDVPDLAHARAAALHEFNTAARAAHCAEVQRQAAAQRYAAAIKRLSDLAIAELADDPTVE